MENVDDLMKRTSAILLVGGQSSRMGRNKALLPFRGRPLWQHVRDVLVAAGCGRVLVSGDVPGADGVPDRMPGLGPLAGIASVIGAQGDALSKDWLLVVPVDLPLITPAALRWLVVQGFDAPAACFAGHALPMLAVNSIAFRQALGTALREGNERDRSMRGLFARVGGREIPVPDGLVSALTNTNTPAEWRAAGGEDTP